MDYLLATRPRFLTITLLGCLIGFMTVRDATGSLPVLVFGVVLALVAHAGANLLNDYHDHLNGSDQINTDRISPFTGGSRFIQDGVISPQHVKGLALGLFLAVVTGGLVICFLTTRNLLWVGAAGLLVGWAYSAPPLKLMARGVFGELGIALAWGLIVVGASMLMVPVPGLSTLLQAGAFGLMAAAILYVNQIPDINADRQAGKMTLAVRTRAGCFGTWYGLLCLAAYGLLMSGFLSGFLTGLALMPLCTAPFALYLVHSLNGPLSDRAVQETLIKRSILHTHVFGGLMLMQWLVP